MEVKLFGEEIAVNAKVVNLQGLSSHADRMPSSTGYQAYGQPQIKKRARAYESAVYKKLLLAARQLMDVIDRNW